MRASCCTTLLLFASHFICTYSLCETDTQYNLNQGTGILLTKSQPSEPLVTLNFTSTELFSDAWFQFQFDQGSPAKGLVLQLRLTSNTWPAPVDFSILTKDQGHPGPNSVDNELFFRIGAPELPTGDTRLVSTARYRPFGGNLRQLFDLPPPFLVDVYAWHKTAIGSPALRGVSATFCHEQPCNNLTLSVFEQYPDTTFHCPLGDNYEILAGNNAECALSCNNPNFYIFPTAQFSCFDGIIQSPLPYCRPLRSRPIQPFYTGSLSHRDGVEEFYTSLHERRITFDVSPDTSFICVRPDIPPPPPVLDPNSTAPAPPPEPPKPRSCSICFNKYDAMQPTSSSNATMPKLIDFKFPITPPRGSTILYESFEMIACSASGATPLTNIDITLIDQVRGEFVRYPDVTDIPENSEVVLWVEWAEWMCVVDLTLWSFNNPELYLEEDEMPDALCGPTLGECIFGETIMGTSYLFRPFPSRRPFHDGEVPNLLMSMQACSRTGHGQEGTRMRWKQSYENKLPFPVIETFPKQAGGTALPSGTNFTIGVEGAEYLCVARGQKADAYGVDVPLRFPVGCDFVYEDRFCVEMHQYIPDNKFEMIVTEDINAIQMVGCRLDDRADSPLAVAEWDVAGGLDLAWLNDTYDPTDEYEVGLTCLERVSRCRHKVHCEPLHCSEAEKEAESPKCEENIEVPCNCILGQALCYTKHRCFDNEDFLTTLEICRQTTPACKFESCPGSENGAYSLIPSALRYLTLLLSIVLVLNQIS